MRRCWIIAGLLALSCRGAAADDSIKQRLECENAAYAAFKTQNEALHSAILRRGAPPITVPEVMADRRMTEAYCLKVATCGVTSGDKPELLGQSFGNCLDGEAAERLRELDEVVRDMQ
jgi:hypothetical protein